MAGPGYAAGPGAPSGPDFPAGNVCAGGLTYTFVVGNSGLQTPPASRSAIPACRRRLRQFHHVDGGGFGCSYTPSTNVVLCTGGTIPGQSTRSVTFVVRSAERRGRDHQHGHRRSEQRASSKPTSPTTCSRSEPVATGIDLTVSKHSDHERTSSRRAAR
jgi:hypothetical protein